MKKKNFQVKVVDFRSDTFSLPTQKMREAIFQAEVGDAVFEEDPTVLSNRYISHFY